MTTYREDLRKKHLEAIKLNIDFWTSQAEWQCELLRTSTHFMKECNKKFTLQDQETNINGMINNLIYYVDEMTERSI